MWCKILLFGAWAMEGQVSWENRVLPFMESFRKGPQDHFKARLCARLFI
jgi:hypothetical protein